LILALPDPLLLCYHTSTVFRKPNAASGVPLYVQLKDQIRHLIETGALSPGDQLPSVRGLAETLVVNPNTVIKVYRELEIEGVLEIHHGLGAFVAQRRRTPKKEDMLGAQQIVHEAIENLRRRGLEEAQIRRLVEAELASEFSQSRR